MKLKQRVMHVTLSLDIGGLETVIKELCRRLDSDLFTSEVLCLRGYDEDNIKQLTEAGIPVHLLRKRHKLDLGFFWRVAKLLRRQKIDILHAHSGCFFYAAVFVCLAAVRKFVYTAHGLPVLNRLQDRIEDNLAGIFCSAIVPVSQEIKAVMERRMPLVKSKMVPILNGIDTERFRPFADASERRKMLDRYNLPEDAFLVGSVGRLDPVKNYSMLLRTFAALLVERGKQLRLIMVGDGPCRAELEKLASELGIAESVTFLGRQYRVFEILPLLDVFVLSSFTEGTSVALLEAQACGVPAVVTNVGGNGDIIEEGINGFLCEVNADADMIAGLQHLQQDSRLQDQMAEAAREVVLQRFGLSAMVQNYEKLFLQGSE